MKHQPSNANLDTAMQHHRAGKLKQAEDIYRKFPHHPDALHLRGLIAHQSQRYKDALDLIAKAILAKPAQAEFYQSFDQAGRALGPEKLIAAYQRLLDQHPGNAIAYNNLGNILNETGRADEAIACYLRAIALLPDFAEAHANLGVAYGRHDKLEQALEHLQKAAALKPNFAPVYQDMGVMQLRLGQVNEAMASFRKKIDLAPDAEAWYSLGRVLGMERRFAEAIDNYQKAIALQPDAIKIHVDLGVAYLRLNQVKNALAACEKAMKLPPQHQKR